MEDDDIDGKPLDTGTPAPKKQPIGAFVPSKWEEVDPELIEQQAMTTSKWELIEQQQQLANKWQASSSPQEEQGAEDSMESK